MEKKKKSNKVKKEVKTENISETVLPDDFVDKVKDNEEETNVSEKSDIIDVTSDNSSIDKNIEENKDNCNKKSFMEVFGYNMMGMIYDD